MTAITTVVSKASRAGRRRSDEHTGDALRRVEAFFADVDQARAYLDRHLQDPTRRRARLVRACAQLPALRSAHALGDWLISGMSRALGASAAILWLSHDALAQAFELRAQSLSPAHVAQILDHLRVLDTQQRSPMRRRAGESELREDAHAGLRALPGFWPWMTLADASLVPMPTQLADLRESVMTDAHGLLVPLRGTSGMVAALWLVGAPTLDAATAAIVEAVAATAGVALEHGLQMAHLAHEQATVQPGRHRTGDAKSKRA